MIVLPEPTPPEALSEPTPPEALPELRAGELRAVTEAHEEACLAEVNAVLDRYGCELHAAPFPVGDLWLLRVGVRVRR